MRLSSGSRHLIHRCHSARRSNSSISPAPNASLPPFRKSWDSGSTLLCSAISPPRPSRMRWRDLKSTTPRTCWIMDFNKFIGICHTDDEAAVGADSSRPPPIYRPRGDPQHIPVNFLNLIIRILRTPRLWRVREGQHCTAPHEKEKIREERQRGNYFKHAQVGTGDEDRACRRMAKTSR